VEFWGAHQHRIDAKGRLALPAVFRDEFAKDKTCFIIPEPSQGCIAVYTRDGFREMVDRLQEAKRAGSFSQAQLTSFLATVGQSTIDSQGRINVPEHLRTFAGLAKDATLIGAANHIAIFAAEVRSPEAALDDLPDISGLL